MPTYSAEQMLKILCLKRLLAERVLKIDLLKSNTKAYSDRLMRIFWHYRFSHYLIASWSNRLNTSIRMMLAGIRPEMAQTLVH